MWNIPRNTTKSNVPLCLCPLLPPQLLALQRGTILFICAGRSAVQVPRQNKYFSLKHPGSRSETGKEYTDTRMRWQRRTNGFHIFTYVF
ncbi:hypothetical protein SAMN04487894_103116 [Niabella drilacis]|uniref:Uncharacterized protein n=1 Tax=Niabella drilacis (strain DSM 25811 / CCM 8410 / CCUG 62505 / LMG 26954 / E90) TaxID=1285928 RepID=A0A1G6N1E2_NIADE|nr:hypothetical protein SAMN04487894_103116 [Niabella drilacis]